MFETEPPVAETAPEIPSAPEEPGLVMRRIRKPDGRYLLLYTFLREPGE